MIRHRCLQIVLVLLASFSFAEPNPLRVETGSAFVWGTAKELVFYPAQNRSYNDPISLLIWPVPPSVALGVTTQWNWTPWTTTSVNLRGVWQLGAGTMTDEDWRVDTLIYGFSRSESYMTSSWAAGIEQGFRWREGTLSLGGLYKNTVWEAWNGTAKYIKTSVTEELQFSGLVLEYRQIWYIPYLGGQWTWELDDWAFTPSFRLSPYTWSMNTDNHMLAAKRVTYLDNVRGGWYGLGGLEVTLPPFSGATIGLRAAWEAAWGGIGDTYAMTPATASLGSISQPSVSLNSAGAGFEEFSVTLFVRN